MSANDVPSGLQGAVLVTVDSLRADAVERMPTLDALGAAGARFERAFAAGNWTPFSFPSILGAAPVFTDRSGLGPAEPTLAGHLSAAGVATAGYNAANGFLTDHWGYDRGFDSFETWVDSGRWLAAHPTVQGWLQYASWPVRRAIDAVGGDDRHAADTSYLRAVEGRAAEFLESRPDSERPFFLWLHLMDTHTPYVPAPRYVRAETDNRSGTFATLLAHARAGLGRAPDADAVAALRSLYDAAARQVDDALARLLDRLEAAGLRDSTLVVVAGDHGEEFMEHGHLAHYPKLYDELVRVPLVVDDPRTEGRRVDAPVSLGALPATVCDALGVASTPFETPSLLPAVRDGDAGAPTEPVVSIAVRGESVTQQPIPRTLDEGDLVLSARDRRWTLVHNTATGARELYDRHRDPGEHENVAGAVDDDAAVALLAEAIGAHRDRIEHETNDTSTESEAGGPSEELAARLEALGYR